MIYKSLIAAFLAVFTSFSLLASPQIAKPAPDFSLTAASGETATLSDYKGKYVVLEWTNHLCPFVKKHYDSGNMQALQKEFTDDGVVWLSIISSANGKQGYVSAQEATSLTESRNATPSAVLMDPDGDVGKLYGAKTTPHMYIITPEGDLAYMGAIDSIKSANTSDIPKAVNYVTLAMNELKEGKTVSKPVTKPYGCSVKY